MSGTEAAASLFGSADSSSDLFATLGTEHNQDQEVSDNFFAGNNADHSVQSEAANIFNNLAEQQPSSDGMPDISHEQPASQSYGYVQDSYAPVHASTSSKVDRGFDTRQEQYSVDVQRNTSYDAYKYVLPAAHDPYAPQATVHASTPNYNSSMSQPTTLPYPGTLTSSYENQKADPYAQPQPVDQYAYTPYNPYTPTSVAGSVITTQQPQYATAQAPSYSSPPPPPRANPATVPAPPTPTTTQVTRPKVSNAYDPPFPVKPYNRRNVSGSTKYGLPPVQSPYAVYQPTTPPPLPPPPRAPSVHLSVAPLPPPPSKATGHTSAYVPSAQPPPSHSSWTTESSTSSTVPSPYDPATYGAGKPPLSGNLTIPVESQSRQLLHPENHDPSGTKHALSDTLLSNVEAVQGAGSNFFDEIDHQHRHIEHGSALEQPLEQQPALASTTPVASNPSRRPSSNTSRTSSPQNPLKALSPPPPRTSLDSGRVSNPRQSPRPLSTSSPGNGLSQPPHASPDLRKELARSEHISRTGSTSPGVDGLATIIQPRGPPPRSGTLRSKPTSVPPVDRVSSPEASPIITQDRYALKSSKVSNVYGIERTGSPSSLSGHSLDGRPSAKHQPPPYYPRVAETVYHTAPMASDSASVAKEDLYAPTLTLKPSPSLAAYGQSPYSYNAEHSPPQETSAIRPTAAPYAPSPSLLGANDPLGRTSARVPVVSFGFGGKLVTCFHDTSSLNTGFDVALSSRTSTKIQMQNWNSLVPESALELVAAFPGPLHADPGPPSTSIMKTTTTTQAKTKKTQLLKYLADRVDEITQGLGYLHSSSTEKRTAEGKLVLVKLLKIMVENDGRLLGTPEMDTAIRIALVPRLEGLLSASESGSSFTATADATPLYTTLPAAADGAPISVTTLRAAALDKIEEFLLRGERHQAYHYALDEKLWAHAMVIASSIDKEAWKEVVNEFIRAELGVKGDSTFTLTRRTDAQVPFINGREGLRVSYSLFSGQGAGAVQELVPKNILLGANGRLPLPAPTIPVPTSGQPIPKTPNLALPTQGVKLPTESLSKWAETLAMMIMSPLTPDASAALTALGDQLMTNGWLEAAHVCYLLSPLTSLVGGVGNPATRIVLLGSKNPASMPTFSKDTDSIIFTEILEHALASAPIPKGQEPNHGLPHLQAYRLIRAYAAAEAGDLGIASRYCAAITASLGRGSAYFTPTMLEQLKGLADRLSGVSHPDKGNSWMAGKISKPSLDTIGGWLEGRFTKLVTGDSDSPASPKEDHGKADAHGFAGPFAHFNTISSTTSSARSSPAPSFVTPAYAMPSHRPGSAMSNKAPPYGYGHGFDRSTSSGMEYIRKQSPVPPTPQLTSSSSYPMIHTQLGNYQNGGAGGTYSNMYGPSSDLQTPRPAQNEDSGVVEVGNRSGNGNVQEVTWWGSSSLAYGSEGAGTDQFRTPTAARFEKVEDMEGNVDSNGFFSMMSNDSFAVGPQSSSATAISSRQVSYDDGEDGDDDLGLGNKPGKKTKGGSGAGEGGGTGGSVSVEQEEKPVAAPAQESEKKTDTAGSQQQGSGWLSRWWGRKENTSGGPVKASLGEESSFYYDKELKRWVNKKVGEEAPKATPPPPPPPRAQTASPGMMAGPKPPGPPPSSASGGTVNGNGNATSGIGLGRPASAIDLTSPPSSKPGMRIRSGLAPPGLDSAPPTPTGTRTAPPGSGSNGAGGPPLGRPKSQASQKRNMRSRYVDVFAQDSGSGSA